MSGAIDGSHIVLMKPSVNVRAWLNRHGNEASTNVLAFVDFNARFRCVAVNDSCVLTASKLAEKLSDSSVVVADGGYAQTAKFLTPWRDNGHLTADQRRYNFIHSSIRTVVERSFGMLKQKWRILLNRSEYLDIGILQRIVIACCILHNIFTGNVDCDQEVQPRGRPVAELINETDGGNAFQLAIQQRMFN